MMVAVKREDYTESNRQFVEKALTKINESKHAVGLIISCDPDEHEISISHPHQMPPEARLALLTMALQSEKDSAIKTVLAKLSKKIGEL